MPRIYLHLTPEVKAHTDPLRGAKNDPTTPYGMIRSAVATSLGYNYDDTELIPKQLPEDSENVAGITVIVEAGAKDAERVERLHAMVADAALRICYLNGKLHRASGSRIQIETDFRTGGHHGNIYQFIELADPKDMLVLWEATGTGWGETMCRIVRRNNHIVYREKLYGESESFG